MLCEKCHKREATVHTVQVINGEKKEHFYCEECAENTSFENPISFQDIFQSLLNYGFGTKQEDHANAYRSTTVKCPSCGMTYEELRRTGKFGCSSCYKAFEPYITGSLKSIHGESTHKGKVPKRNGGALLKKHELDELKRKLVEAIAAENFEEAAVLRDRIRSLEGDDQNE